MQTARQEREEVVPLLKLEPKAVKILVVEDDAEMRSLLEETLREEGYQAIGAPDTLSAMITLFAEGADLIVTDWKMPAMDGLELLKCVKRYHPALGVVFVTAYAHPDLRRRALENGASSFLAKPFRRETLLDHIRAALAGLPKA
jgi:CheY-like chemotaxis protein